VTTDPTDLSYAEATTELERILAELEADDVDVDHLASRVQRAALLIRLCRAKVGAARLEIETVLADLDDLADPGAR
jgi:exodeoxyribonuclease VII small subunit